MTVLPSPPVLTVDAGPFLGVAAPRHVRPRLDIAIADRAYVPQVDDLQRDWVASVAAPAFRILHARRGDAACRSFAAVGTGSGVDALAGIEFLGATRVGITDLFEEVVATAAGNVRRNVLPGHPLELFAGAGDLLTPLKPYGVRFDVIYENLPNLPLADAGRLEIDRTSAAFMAPREEWVPTFVKDWLLVLHYLALVQAKDALEPGGTVISTLGGRVSLKVLTDMADSAGLHPSFLTYWWKEQADAADVIGSYAQWQRYGLGPFHFYPADLLQEVFSSLDPEQAGRDAFAIERDLASKRLDAITAWNAFQRGVRIGHTVAVLQSDLR
jgi:hypothetical protein